MPVCQKGWHFGNARMPEMLAFQVTADVIPV